MYTETLTLANGVKIPQLGLGTWFIDDANAAEAAKASIDGRREMPSVFDGRTMEHPLTHLRLTGVQQFESGAVWLRYAL